MSPWREGLEGVHLAIAEEQRSPLHVLAGPGTGKTFAMMRRVARLLHEGVSPDDILAISFTRTAAEDLREQLKNLGVDGANYVRASTLHSFCFHLLNQEAVFRVTNRTARPLLSYEVRAMEVDLAEQFDGLREVRRLLSAYEAAWARLQTDAPGGPSPGIDARFHEAVLQWLAYHRAMLIGELIPLTLAFARENPAADVIPNVQHVLVDEYQDLNRAEQELVQQLAREGTLTVIGDDCQSIYSFRHANPEGIRRFTADNPGSVSLTIELCRRCPPNIVAMSNALIANDPNRARPVPLTADGDRDDARVVVVQHPTLEEEVTTLADFVAHYLNENPELPPGQVLILTPRRFIGNSLRDALIARGMNAMSYFTEDPVQPAAAAEGFALLTLLVNPTDRAALRAWLGFGSGTGRRGGYRRLMAAAQAENTEPSEILRRLNAEDMSLPYSKPLLERWNVLSERLDALRGLQGLELVRAIWPPDEEDADDIRLMAEQIAAFTSDPDLILEELRLAVTQPHLPGSDGDVIRVMSLHKSKGLTANLVVVAGAMAGALPHVDNTLSQPEQDRMLAEQRRLFYVAITRATDVLVISSPVMIPFAQAMQAQVAVNRRTWANGQQFAVVAMSPFVSELGPTRPAVMRSDEWRRVEGF